MTTKLSKDQILLIDLVTRWSIEQDGIITSEDISGQINSFSSISSLFKKELSDEEKIDVLKELECRINIKMDEGVCLKDTNHISWFFSAKKNIENENYWDSYRKYLTEKKGFSPNVIKSLDKVTDTMMDMLGNPKKDISFSRKGLIIGDVQSGKTATYTALINKAADAGYKIIIVLTGTIEKLRRQTQKRLDLGFVGLDSASYLNNKKNIKIGVGENRKDNGWSLTSTLKDFSKAAANQFNGQLRNISAPVLFVLKKNVNTLKTLERWLSTYNVDNDTKKINAPMLLIDDEADNASINTKKEEENPTAINTRIRELLKLFKQSNYVAFTATPYANIFIDPDSDNEMLEDDLFPKDFIYALDAPTNYIGARNIFNEDNSVFKNMLHENDDCESFLPLKHKKNKSLGELPLSLKKAIVSFFITNAIRDLRGQVKTHRSMLVNISRFTDIHGEIVSKIEDYIEPIKREIKNYYKCGDEALNHEGIKFIKSVYDELFLNQNNENYYNWNDILKALKNAVVPIVVRAVNGKNENHNLNYDETDEGLRVIVVGGFSLSRGLTLEGLSTSYLYRSSKTYDTLMQMGRWFGYRDGYSDICHIWMSSQLQDWYSYISDASDKLVDDVKRMLDSGLTPKDFGLGIRQDKDTLLITAKNKMRNTDSYKQTVALSGSVVETPYITANSDKNDNNLINVNTFLNKLLTRLKYSWINTDDSIASKHPQILNVEKQCILDLLENIEFDSHNSFSSKDLADFIRNSHSQLEKWDVVIVEGDGSHFISLGQRDIKPVTRAFVLNKDINSLVISGTKRRLGTVGVYKAGLTKDECYRIEKAAKNQKMTSHRNKNLNQDDYFNVGIRRNPLLAIYPIELKPDIKENEHIGQKEKEEFISKYSNVAIGFAIGIPYISGCKKETYTYIINKVKFKEIYGDDDNEREDDE